MNQRIDFAFGSDIDSTCWLVQHKELGRQRKPFGDDDFLLIATRKKLGLLISIGSFDGKFVDHFVVGLMLPGFHCKSRKDRDLIQ